MVMTKLFDLKPKFCISTFVNIKLKEVLIEHVFKGISCYTGLLKE